MTDLHTQAETPDRWTIGDHVATGEGRRGEVVRIFESGALQHRLVIRWDNDQSEELISAGAYAYTD